MADQRAYMVKVSETGKQESLIDNFYTERTKAFKDAQKMVTKTGCGVWLMISSMRGKLVNLAYITDKLVVEYGARKNRHRFDGMHDLLFKSKFTVAAQPTNGQGVPREEPPEKG